MNIRNLVALERRRYLEKSRKKRRPRVVRQLLPKGVMLRYYAGLSQYIADIREVVDQTVTSKLEMVRREKQNEEGTALDSYVDTIEEMIRAMTISLGARSTISVNTMLLDIGQRTAKWNNKEWQKVVRATFGVPTLARAPWMNERMKIFIGENTSLIKSIDTTLQKNVSSIIRSGVDGGLRHEAIARQIRDTFNVQKKRAKLIARDQVSKLNGKMSEERQKDVGVNVYTWETSDDARVRKFEGKGTHSHRVLDGKYCRWDDPSVYSDDGVTWVKRPAKAFQGHPGQDIQCRCWANPVFKEYEGL